MSYINRAKQILNDELQELQHLPELIDEEFDRVVDMIYESTTSGHSKLVLMGIGKTGIIGHKIASSLASTGTPSIFVNAAEAVHGDLGMLMPEDIVMLVSNSGATNEILNVIAPIKKIGCTLIALTGNTRSPLANDCDYVLSTHVDSEVCPLGLAPTTSTAATLLMGDVLMVCLMEKRQFKAENFAVYHPGGALGRRLLHKVENKMQTQVPIVRTDTLFRQLTKEMSDKHLGMTLVENAEGKIVGIITDGDLRRAIQKYDELQQLRAEDIMTHSYKHIHKSALLTEALELMDRHNITTVAVTENQQSEKIIGIISIHHIIDFA